MDQKQQHIHQLTDHFFRHHYGRMVAVLTRYFGLTNLETAQDIVQDTLIDAMHQWSTSGIPSNPEGWIMDVAKKKTINLFRRNQLLQHKILPHIQSTAELQDTLTITNQTINDSMLQMIFATCHPAIPVKSQIPLALRTLCGLSIPEIASALLTNESTINKRLLRAKEKLRGYRLDFDSTENNLTPDRLTGVLRTLYLLFNSGYYAPHHDQLIRHDLCYEAIRLLKIITTRFPESTEAEALLALMLFSFARIDSRIDEEGAIVLLEEQDRSLWDMSLIAEGMEHLHKSAQGNRWSIYHLLAGIAAEHSLAADFEHTNWPKIYQLYQDLSQLENSSIIQLNKAVARFFCHEQQEAVQDLLALQQAPELKNNTIYFTTLGKLYELQQNPDKASHYYRKALQLTSSTHEQNRLKRVLAT